MPASRFFWLVLASASALLAACAGDDGRTGSMQVLDQRPDGITIRDRVENASFAGVTADEHCATYGKSARLLEQKTLKGYDAVEYPGAAVFIFQCFDPNDVQ